MKAFSSNLLLGIKAPDFLLLDVITNKYFSLYKSNVFLATVVMFICNHCPYVKRINKKLVEISNIFIKQDVRFLAINSNDSNLYPEDSVENMKKIAIIENYPFPYLYDETQNVAKQYQANCTPDFYIFDKNLILVYHGQFDDSRLTNKIEITGSSIKSVLENIIIGKHIDTKQKKSLGCSIKWKKI